MCAMRDVCVRVRPVQGSLLKMKMCVCVCTHDMRAVPQKTANWANSTTTTTTTTTTMVVVVVAARRCPCSGCTLFS